ncbi:MULTISPECIES: homocysteine S-methyltransferase family protein [unclassified Streptomyces]|uniref:homocysteine S-methyltransferase family protein n=1 Tax=unclassified Streptomyces TaxID=2593676 RepID=UPI002E75AF1D|nr:homocysteine S-methyltransferase family protein [Streptomyces sp. JV184]MEE1743366.1 homocysteine S-methyltransferase family protein [Streptomyces sp. JV184]
MSEGRCLPNDGSVWELATAIWHPPRTGPRWPVAAWRCTGARLIGGCCRIGPARIADLAAECAGPNM